MADGVVSMCSKVPCLEELSLYIKKMAEVRLSYFTDANQKIREADSQVYKCWSVSPKSEFLKSIRYLIPVETLDILCLNPGKDSHVSKRD